MTYRRKWLFERRALAVEKERAIAENELATKTELARREKTLISEEAEISRCVWLWANLFVSGSATWSISANIAAVHRSKPSRQNRSFVQQVCGTHR
jgi:hypothetical protein